MVRVGSGIEARPHSAACASWTGSHLRTVPTTPAGTRRQWYERSDASDLLARSREKSSDSETEKRDQGDEGCTNDHAILPFLRAPELERSVLFRTDAVRARVLSARRSASPWSLPNVRGISAMTRPTPASGQERTSSDVKAGSI